MAKLLFATGGGSGIGLTLGRVFAKAGCNVMLADTKNSAERDAIDTIGSQFSYLGLAQVLALDSWKESVQPEAMGDLRFPIASASFLDT